MRCFYILCIIQVSKEIHVECNPAIFLLHHSRDLTEFQPSLVNYQKGGLHYCNRKNQCISAKGTCFKIFLNSTINNTQCYKEVPVLFTSGMGGGGKKQVPVISTVKLAFDNLKDVLFLSLYTDLSLRKLLTIYVYIVHTCTDICD